MFTSIETTPTKRTWPTLLLLASVLILIIVCWALWLGQPDLQYEARGREAVHQVIFNGNSSVTIDKELADQADRVEVWRVGSQQEFRLYRGEQPVATFRR